LAQNNVIANRTLWFYTSTYKNVFQDIV